MTYISLSDWASKHGVNKMQAAKWARQQRIPAQKAGHAWAIADDAPVPEKRKPGRKPDMSKLVA